jgi:hypothetical protein
MLKPFRFLTIPLVAVLTALPAHAGWTPKVRQGFIQICVGNVFRSGVVKKDQSDLYCACVIDALSDQLSVEGEPPQAELEKIYASRLTPAFQSPENADLHGNCVPAPANSEELATAEAEARGPIQDGAGEMSSQSLMALLQAPVIRQKSRGELEYQDKSGRRLGSSRPNSQDTERRFYDARGAYLGKGQKNSSRTETRYHDASGSYIAKTTRSSDGTLTTYGANGERLGKSRIRSDGKTIDTYDASGSRTGTARVRK